MFSRHQPDPGDIDPAVEDLEVAPSRLRHWLRRSGIYFSIVALLLIFVCLLLANRIIYNIEPGEIGVRWARFGGGTVLDHEYGEGLQLLPPWDEMYIYNVRVQEVHDTLSLLTSNGLPISITYSCRFQPDLKRVPQLHQTFGPDYADVIVKPEIASALREVIGNYRPEDIYARDEQGLINEMYNVLAAEMINRDVTIKALLIKDIVLPPELEKAINDKLVADQKAEAYEFKLKAEESERTRKTIEAEGIRDFEKISGISILKWRGIEATVELAKSPNSKIVIIGTGPNGMPLILNGEK